MFTVNEYRIVFKRRWHNRVGDHLDDSYIKGDGRYDTKCEIYVQDPNMVGVGFAMVYHKEPRFTGIAKLHPKDKPDKIVGKKIALRDALLIIEMDVIPIKNLGDITDVKYYPAFNKEVRTAIWKAFWEWVLHWGLPENQRLGIIKRIKDCTR